MQSVEDETDQAAAQVLTLVSLCSGLYPLILSAVYATVHLRLPFTKYQQMSFHLLFCQNFSELAWHGVPPYRCHGRVLSISVQALQLETEAELAEFNADPAPKPLDPEAEEDDNDADDTRHASWHFSQCPCMLAKTHHALALPCRHFEPASCSSCGLSRCSEGMRWEGVLMLSMASAGTLRRRGRSTSPRSR